MRMDTDNLRNDDGKALGVILAAIILCLVALGALYIKRYGHLRPPAAQQATATENHQKSETKTR